MFSWAYGSGELIKGIENDEIWISSTTFFIIDYQNKKEKPDMDETGKIFTIIFWNWKLLNLPYLSFNNTVLEVIWKKKRSWNPLLDANPRASNLTERPT